MQPKIGCFVSRNNHCYEFAYLSRFSGATVPPMMFLVSAGFVARFRRVAAHRHEGQLTPSSCQHFITASESDFS